MQWRRITILRLGDSSETEYGMNSMKEGKDGVWVDDNVDSVGKFYCFERFLHVQSHKPSSLGDKYA